MRKPPGQSGKGIRAWDVVRGGGALLGHGESHRRRCSDLGRELQAYPTTVTGSGDIADAHRGVGRSRKAEQGGCRRRPSAAHGGARERCRCWASLALRSPWFDSWGCCGDATGSGGLRSRRRREIGRRTTHLRGWLRVEIPARRGAILGAEVPRRVKGPWRSCGAAKGGLGCGGAAERP